MTLSTKVITNDVIGEILTEALEDEWGASVEDRIKNSSLLDNLTEEERDDVYENIENIVLDVKDSIHKLNDFISSVGS